MNLNTTVLKKGFVSGVKFMSKHAPEIMTAMGVIAFGVTIAETVESTKAVSAELQELQKEAEALTTKKKIFVIVKHSWKAFLAGLIAIGLFVGAHHISFKRQAALSAAYAMTMNDFKEYKAKVVETIGEKKADKVEDAIAEDRIRAYPFNETTIVNGNGPLWIFAWTNTAFRGNLEDIRRMTNDLNDDIYQCKGKAYLDGEITLNDYISELSRTCNAPQLGKVALGEQFGWRADLTGPIDLDIRYSHNAIGEPCGYINVKPLLLSENIRDIYYE